MCMLSGDWGWRMQGLENEYDRLLGQHDQLTNQLRKLDPSSGHGSSGGRFSKMGHLPELAYVPLEASIIQVPML